jgi:SSS family solute:Na+ symporter
MSWIDWLVLVATIAFIIIYGIYRSRGLINIEGYFKGNNTLPWYAVGLSVMATQASAITFLSAPGQAYTDGMRFVQYYFGLPIAMIVICVVFIPLYHRLNVYTAYEFLENRFDLKTRSLAATLFLIQRGLAAGLTIYAPSIILSSILGWNIYFTNVIIGGLVLLYTYSGGTKAVSYTQLGQMVVILAGMLIAGTMIVKGLPEGVGFSEALTVSGKLGHMNVIDFKFDLNEKYNVWSGIIGGFFLALSYFGTDQSQVGRYIGGKSLSTIRIGLLFNGLVKIPMQFFILLVGILLLAFYQFQQPPLFFNEVETEKILNSPKAQEYLQLNQSYQDLHQEKTKLVLQLLAYEKNQNSTESAAIQAALKEKHDLANEMRKKGMTIMKANDRFADTNDTNYIFLHFVTNYLPKGLVGLLIAVIFSASMSSTSSELNALASTSIVDIYKRSIKPNQTPTHYLNTSKYATLIWGVFAIGVANIASELGSLIEAVNVLGSLFYGTVLGIFLSAFFLKKVKGGAVFYAAIIAELVVLYCFWFTSLTFLWFNLLGAALVMILGFIISKVPSLR